MTVAQSIGEGRFLAVACFVQPTETQARTLELMPSERPTGTFLALERGPQQEVLWDFEAPSIYTIALHAVLRVLGTLSHTPSALPLQWQVLLQPPFSNLLSSPKSLSSSDKVLATESLSQTSVLFLG